MSARIILHEQIILKVEERYSERNRLKKLSNNKLLIDLHSFLRNELPIPLRKTYFTIKEELTDKENLTDNFLSISTIRCARQSGPDVEHGAEEPLRNLLCYYAYDNFLDYKTVLKDILGTTEKKEIERSEKIKEEGKANSKKEGRTIQGVGAEINGSNQEAVKQTKTNLPRHLQLLKEQQLIDDKNSESQIFRDFLKSQYLPYYSREKFHHKHIPNKKKDDFLTEGDMLDFIEKDTCYGLIIHGQGGIGKTRLMTELGIRLLDKDYIGIIVTTNFKDFDGLMDYINLDPQKKYLLLFDYIEMQTGVFSETATFTINNRLQKVNIS